MQETVITSSPWFDLVPDTRRFPPISGEVTTDAIVLGGGMVGVMAAYCLATSGRDVALVERNHVGTGDSGFTTAFLTRVPDAAAADLMQRYGRGFLRDLFAATADAQRFITSVIRERRIDCDLVGSPAARVGYYLFRNEADLLDVYLARMEAEGIALESGSCLEGEGEGASIPWGDDGFAPYRQGCFVNSEGYGNYRATLPGAHVYVGLLGRTADTRSLDEWAWMGNEDVPGIPTLWHQEFVYRP